MYCRVLSSIHGLYTPDTGRTLRCDYQKCVLPLPNALGGKGNSLSVENRAVPLNKKIIGPKMLIASRLRNPHSILVFFKLQIVAHLVNCEINSMRCKWH